MQTWNVLHTPQIMCILLCKLSGGTKEKWPRRVLVIRLKQGKEDELVEVIEFVNDENLIVNDTVFYKEAV